MLSSMPQSPAEDLKAALAKERERLLSAIAGVSEQQFKKRPEPTPEDPQPWCIAEVLAHLLELENRWNERASLALAESATQVEPIPDDVLNRAPVAGRAAPVPQLIHGLLAARRQTERLLDQASSLAGGLERYVEDTSHGRQNVEWIVVEKIIRHEREHTQQIEAMKAAVAAAAAGARW